MLRRLWLDAKTTLKNLDGYFVDAPLENEICYCRLLKMIAFLVLERQ